MTLLKELRTAAGDLTQVDLANESGVGLLAIREYERGKFELSDSDLEKISFVIASRLQLAYVAGLFDRASTWNITKVLPNKSKYTRADGSNCGPINFPVYSARIRFTTKHKILATVLEQVFGVGFTTYHKGTGSWTFFAANRKAKDVAEELLPYLVLKRREAQLIIDLTELLENSPIKGRSDGRYVIATYLPSFRTTVYETREDASEALGIPIHSINGCLIGKQHNTKNNTYTFSYGESRPRRDKAEMAKPHMDALESLYQQMADLKVKADGTKKKQRRKPS